MGQKWLPFLTYKLGGSWGWQGLERYLKDSREHLEGFGRASEEPERGNFCGSKIKMVAIFDPQTWGIFGGLGASGKVSEGLKRAS